MIRQKPEDVTTLNDDDGEKDDDFDYFDDDDHDGKDDNKLAMTIGGVFSNWGRETQLFCEVLIYTEGLQMHRKDSWCPRSRPQQW